MFKLLDKIFDITERRKRKDEQDCLAKEFAPYLDGEKFKNVYCVPEGEYLQVYQWAVGYSRVEITLSNGMVIFFRPMYSKKTTGLSIKTICSDYDGEAKAIKYILNDRELVFTDGTYSNFKQLMKK